MARKSFATKTNEMNAAKDALNAQLAAAQESMIAFYASLEAMGVGQDDDMDEVANQLHDVVSAMESMTGIMARYAETKAPGRVQVPAATAALVAANID